MNNINELGIHPIQLSFTSLLGSLTSLVSSLISFSSLVGTIISLSSLVGSLTFFLLIYY